MGGDVESGEKVNCKPRMHIMADLSNEKFSLHLSQCSIELMGGSRGGRNPPKWSVTV